MNLEQPNSKSETHNSEMLIGTVPFDTTNTNLNKNKDQECRISGVKTAITFINSRGDFPEDQFRSSGGSPVKCCFKEVEDRLEQMFAGIDDEFTAYQCGEEKNSRVNIDRRSRLELSKLDDVTDGKRSTMNDNTSEASDHTVLRSNISDQSNINSRQLKAQDNDAKIISGVTKPGRSPTHSVLFEYEDKINREVTFEVKPPSNCTPSYKFHHLVVTPDTVKKTDTVQIMEPLLHTTSFIGKDNREQRTITQNLQLSSFKLEKDVFDINMFQDSGFKPGDNNYFLSAEKRCTKRKINITQPKRKFLHKDNLVLRDLGKVIVSNEQKHKSPFIVVKREGTINIRNAPIAEEIYEKQVMLKKSIGLRYSNARKRGLHSSTLSNKYDANTTDSSWICVFCKHGPHSMKLGDLFGPYIVTSDCDEYKAAVMSSSPTQSEETYYNKRRRLDIVQLNSNYMSSTTVARMLNSALHQVHPINKKTKSNDDITTSTKADLTNTLKNIFMLGMCKVSEKNYEVWLHEDCCIWAPGVYLVGTSLVGLAASIWNSFHYSCIFCGASGSIVCCFQRDCKKTAHVPCARSAQWELDESSQRVFCKIHSHQSINVISENNLCRHDCPKEVI